MIKICLKALTLKTRTNINKLNDQNLDLKNLTLEAKTPGF
jgi:hypothetical protein